MNYAVWIYGNYKTIKKIYKNFSGAYILSNNRTWCPDHFSCANSACGRRLLDCGFVEAEEGKNYCEKCYESLIAPTCNKCGVPITTVIT